MQHTQAQATQARQQAALTQGPSAPPQVVAASPYGGLYPSLEDEYMGLQLTQYRTVSVEWKHRVMKNVICLKQLTGLLLFGQCISLASEVIYVHVTYL